MYVDLCRHYMFDNIILRVGLVLLYDIVGLNL